jgi:hypothetical protein
MTLAHLKRIGSGVLSAWPVLAMPGSPAWAQAQAAPAPQGTPVPGEAADVIVALVAMALALAVIGVAVRALDLGRERADRAAALQARISDVLLMDPAVGRAPITVTVRAPRWRLSPMTVEVGGRAPTPALHEAAMALIMREAFASGVRFRVEDRLRVASPVPRAA